MSGPPEGSPSISSLKDFLTDIHPSQRMRILFQLHDGEAAVARALESYGQEYGQEAKALVLEYADLDYDAMPEYAGIEG